MEKDCRGTVVGMKQVLRAAAAGRLKKVFIAEDAEAHIREKLLAACNLHGVEVETRPTMKELGKLCGIEVGAACAGILRA